MTLAEIEIARAEKTKRWQSRRLIAALAAFSLASATVLASCGSGDDTATESTTTEAADVTSCEADPENPLCGSSPTNMQGKTIEFGYSRIAGWPPSAAPEAMWPQFQAYAKEKYGYDVSALKFAEAPFGELFQKVAPTLAAGSSEFNLMIVDSQWLGALAEPGWIVKADTVFELNPDLDIEPFSSLVTSTYQVYPDGSGQRWGFPQMPDTQGVFLRKDWLEDPENQAAFKAETGKDLPTTYEQYENITMADFVEIATFFNRPAEGYNGTALMYSKEYDFFTCAWNPFAYSQGGKIWDPETRTVWGVLNSDINAKALEEFVGLKVIQPAGFADQGIGSMIDLFTQGKVFSAFQWLAVGAFMHNPEAPDGGVKSPDQYLAIPLPKFPGSDGQPNIIGAMGGQPWVINAFNSEDQTRVAVDFLKWWYLPETQDTFILEYGGLPWSKEGAANPAYQSIPYLKPFLYMLEEGRSQDFWHEPDYSQMLAIQQEAFSAYATGQVTDPMKVLEYAAAKQQEILYNAGRSETPPPDGTGALTLN
jgi:multiple sugar transport system substrate-binding protein